MAVRSNGTGNIVAAGEAEVLDLESSGTGAFDGAALATAQATVRKRGTGNVVLNVSETLDVSLTGTATVEYIGNPTVNKIVTGTGVVRQHAGR